MNVSIDMLSAIIIKPKRKDACLNVKNYALDIKDSVSPYKEMSGWHCLPKYFNF